MDEEYIRKLREAVLSGQEQNVLNEFSNGDYCFGYSSESVPGTEIGRRGRDRRPRMRAVINPEHAAWVTRIFIWFVKEHRSMNWIATELTRLGPPKDHPSSTPGWGHALVKNFLRRLKYIGWWPWGKTTTCRDPNTGEKWQEERPPEDAEKWLRHRPHLQIVPDEFFAEAQSMLDALEEKYAGAQRGRQVQGQSPRQRTASAPAPRTNHLW